MRSVTLNLANKFSQCTFSVAEHYDLFSGLVKGQRSRPLTFRLLSGVTGHPSCHASADENILFMCACAKFYLVLCTFAIVSLLVAECLESLSSFSGHNIQVSSACIVVSSGSLQWHLATDFGYVNCRRTTHRVHP